MTYRLIAAMLLATTAPWGGAMAHAASQSAQSAAQMGAASGVDLSKMDRSVRPGDEFYDFANGAWMKAAAIPADQISIGSSYISRQRTEANLNSLIAEVMASHPAPGTDAARVKDYYTAYMNTAAIEAAGMKPAQADLARFAAIASVSDLSRVLGEQLAADVDPFNATNFSTENLFGLFVTQDLQGKQVVPYLLQGGLGLPEREYYLSAEPRMAALRDQYKTYIARFLTDAGFTDAPARAQRIFDLETKIAAAHMDRAASEDYAHRTAEWSQADFAARAPGIDWTAFFTAAHLDGEKTFSAYHDQAIPRLSALVASEPLETWRDWLAFHQLNRYADVLPVALRDDHFAFYGTVLMGTPTAAPRDKAILAAEARPPYSGATSLGAVLGNAVGKLYVDQYFPASSKREIEGMAVAIKAAFVSRLEASTTLAPATRDEAIAKVRAIEVGVGYPNRWQDYSAFTVDPGNPYANAVNGGKVATAIARTKLDKPLDRGEWWMNPQLVNAVNLPLQNALNFPAAILQQPEFDPANDPAANYGAIGATIGHEISHSFDNGGASFDAAGALRDWWTATDRTRFDAAGKALADQFDTYAPFPDAHVNGELTLGENIADVVGLQAAYDAYRASLGGKEAPVIDGLTGDQRFFIAFAQSWSNKMRDEALRGRLATDGHAPGHYRALTVRNIDAWYAAFGVKPGDKLYLPPEKRVRMY